MDACKLDYTGFDTFSLPIKHSSSLTSLTINKCFLDVELLESLLLRTPALVHLKLISRNRAFDSIFDGYNWEQFICAKLPKLDEFQFFFSFIEETMDYFGILNSIITSFQTLFWLYDQQWFTTSAYDFQSSTFELQTTTIRTVGPTNSIKFAVSALDGTYHFIGPTQQANESNTLFKLNLKDNRIGRNGAEHLANLQQNNSTLKSLELSGNPSYLCLIVEAAHKIRHNQAPSTFNLERLNIDDKGAQYLAEALKTNNTLISLILAYNDMSDVGIELIAHALRNNITLANIELRGNRSNLCIVVEMAQRIKCDKILTTLNLRQNRIGDIGAEYLAILLRNNPTLKELDLSLNRITNHGAQNIALGLQQNKVLTRMNLSQNQIEDDGARQLVEILHDNQTLINLELHNNPIRVNLNYRRLFTKEGDINLIRLNIEQRRHRHLRDFFTSLLEFGWCSILSLLALSFVLSWLIFAGFWFLIMHIHGDFSHNSANSTWIPCVAGVRTLVGVVLFSIETQQTIGYGTRSVTEQCESGVILLAIHTCFGLVMQALWAGIDYSKLARPKNRRRTLIWSRQAVIFLRDRYLTLQVRIADIRPRSTLVEAHVRMYFIAERVTNEKEKIPLNILDMNVGLDTGRDRLLLMWPLTIEHRIDFKSPL
ncbi:unnamed protein product [Rotaria sp. Silwood1]|nr:unnamed protein product [Rotaria sp. Silwood1]CAF1618501.1 unnamed protein product [Rotaria sp. Silwood1]